MKAMLDTTHLQRIPLDGEYGDAHNGIGFFRPIKGQTLMVQFSNGGGWDHVSVSRKDRCPTWEEMCLVKDYFFEPEDVVVQFHPRTSEYRNLHPYCLHLWRAQGITFPTPDPLMVAP